MSGMCSPKRFLVKLDEPASVAGFLGAHAIEDGRRGGEGLPQAFGVIGVDALILFFEGDGQSENLAFGKAVRSFSCSRCRARREAPLFPYTTSPGRYAM